MRIAYVIIALAVFLPALREILRRRSSALLLTWLTGATLLAYLDWFAGGWLRLYTYGPHFTAMWAADHVLGILLAEIFFVGFLNVLLVIYLPGWLGIALATLLLAALEETFLRARIMSHEGWQTWYTAIGFPIYFRLIAGFYDVVRRNDVTRGGLLIVRRVVICAFFSILFAMVRSGSDLLISHIAFMPTAFANQAMGRFILTAGVLIPHWLWVVYGSLPDRPVRLLVTRLTTTGVIWIASIIPVITFRPPWNPVMLAIVDGIFLGFACLCDEWVGAWAPSTRSPDGLES